MSNSLEIRVCRYEVGRVSIIATGRKLRPKQYRMNKEVDTSTKARCPFCPGNEYDTPPAILVLTKEIKFTKDDENSRVKDWLVRIFPNKYPALSREPKAERGEFTIYGYHEVIVESPLHDENEYLKRLDHMYYMLLALRKRIKEIFDDPNIENILVIKNSGARAGASIRHPHLQLFANTFIPPNIINEIKGFEEYMSKFGECPLCNISMNRSPRTILDTRYFRVEARYAPRQSYELIIIPKIHRESLLKASDEELKDLAWVLGNVIRALKNLLGEIDYNYWIHMAPKNVGKVYHWHIELQPLIETWGGYEKGSSVYIVTVKPEDAASKLRELLAT